MQKSPEHRLIPVTIRSGRQVNYTPQELSRALATRIAAEARNQSQGLSNYWNSVNTQQIGDPGVLFDVARKLTEELDLDFATKSQEDRNKAITATMGVIGTTVVEYSKLQADSARFKALQDIFNTAANVASGKAKPRKDDKLIGPLLESLTQTEMTKALSELSEEKVALGNKNREALATSIAASNEAHQREILKKATIAQALNYLVSLRTAGAGLGGSVGVVLGAVIGSLATELISDRILTKSEAWIVLIPAALLGIGMMAAGGVMGDRLQKKLNP
jgi:hypothetical protein